MLITISREFSSGGREIGKRLSEELGICILDNEIIDHIAKNSGFDKNFLESLSQKSLMPFYQSTIAHKINFNYDYLSQKRLSLAAEISKFIKNVADTTSAVIIGRSTDVILKDYKTFDIFAYASLNAKIERFVSREKGGEGFSRNQIIKKMKEIDRSRALSRISLDGGKWGSKENYDLLKNTTDLDIKSIIKPLAAYIRSYFGE